MCGLSHCVQYLRKKNVPLILLGGGGYTVMNIAWMWTYETASSNMEDMNIKDRSLEQVWINMLEHLRELNSAPSIGIHDVLRESLLKHLGFEHMQFVYKLQESDTASSSSDDKKFFQSKVVFDDMWQWVKLVQELGLGFGLNNLTEPMERGGGGDGDGEDDWIETDT
ncbi:hypothetical protein EDD18DRAFT_1109987 [Armillaria luteobubalina]|uniref:Histone deacetylase n=1 Tax=Armillaria luteobubalina TaxID=153913 RepID=A0AA39PTN1_9AGAR|nr:hypothetical protein EDD18DRAFT_1109987 [Armillaria luteobubalina]